MNLTLSVDERLIKHARKVAQSMGKSLNQLIRDYLEQLSSENNVEQEIEELRRLSASGHGRSKGWRFDREEAHERS